VSVNFATANGTATVAGGDYAANSGTLSWIAGNMDPKTFDVTISNDATPEGSETVLLSLSGPTGSATLGTSAATLTIFDDDATFVLNAASYSVGEGGGNLAVTIQRQNGTLGDVTVRLTTTNGTAASGTDFTGGNFDVLFNLAAGTSQIVNIPITDDGDTESPETFTVGLSIQSGNGVLGTPNSAVVTINDNEAPSIVSTSPAHAATNAPLDTHFVITFSEAMNTTNTQNAITISRNPVSSPLPVARYVWSAGNTVLTIVFDTVAPFTGLNEVNGEDLLTENTTYTVTVGTGATAQGSGLAFGSADARSFTTYPDATPPSILSITPALSAPIPSGAPVTFTVTFDEPVSTASAMAQIESSDVYQQQDSVGGGATGDMTVTFSNSTTLQIALATGFPARRGFRLEVLNIVDLAGNSLSFDTDYHFVTDNPATDVTAPRVSGTSPVSGAAGVSRDAAILVGFTELMHPSVASHVTVSGTGAAGVAVDVEYQIEDISVLFIRPRKAWEVGTVTVTINAAAGQARDLDGNLLQPSAGSVYSFSFTTVADAANDVRALAVDASASGIKSGATKVGEFSLQSFLLFNYATTTTRALVDRSVLSAVDVSLFETSTGLPVKGYTVTTGDEDGTIRIERLANRISPLALNTGYTLRLNTSLRTSRGVALPSAIDLPFTTRNTGENATVQFAHPPEAEVQSDGTTVGLNLRAEVQNPDSAGQAITVTASAPTSFSNSGTSSTNTSFFNYQYEADNAPGLAGTGTIPLTFLATDDGPSAQSVSVTKTGYAFTGTELAGSLDATNSATPVYSWTWAGGVGGAAPVNVEVLLVHVVRVVGVNEEVVYEAVVGRDATLFMHPADQSLPSGSYRFYLGAVRFKEIPNSGEADFGIRGGEPFTVP
jgi:hypothetical protein